MSTSAVSPEFGDGAAHLHVHLVPQAQGDALLTEVVRRGTAEVPVGALRETADRIARALATA
jgi:diadenosine tetraphosphate (Ap4A) HIT family hydrolase